MDNELFEKRKNLIYELLCNDMYVPMKERELAAFMNVDRSERGDLKKVLKALVDEGKIRVTAKGKYIKQDEDILTGTFIGNARGFGFVEIEGREEDLYIPEDKAHNAFHMDKVSVRLLPGKSGKRQEAEVLKVLGHGSPRIVGVYDKSGNFGFVIPDNGKIATDIFIPRDCSMGAVDGHKVVAELISYGDETHKPEGKIVEILGHTGDPGVDIMSVVRGFELPVEFGERVLNQAARVPEEVSAADMEGRMDLRELMMVTIDGEDAKDLDDAVSLTKEGGLYHLGVHIADVSNYVQENSAMDREALLRGTSVYLVDRVIPMLPHKLSNGICSLNQGVDRLALSCLMDIDEKGSVVNYEIAESVIRVDRRMTYTSVKRILEEHDEEERREYEQFIPMFELMEKLADILRRKRHGRGSIDFDFPESRIILDAQGKPVDIRPYERNVATKIIEEFMLIANETVAEHFFWLEAPFIYRTHDEPELEKVEKLEAFISNLGYHIKVGRDEIHPRQIQKLLDKIEGAPEEMLISRLTLRSMKQAKYTVECSGHFGLACKYYCHFTSPIRRYPDLQIHRIIKDQLRGRLNEKHIERYKGRLPEVAKHSSITERRADEAERAVDKLKKAEYMEGHIGEVFEGVISGITSWGLYVELQNTVEGLVHVSRMAGDYFYYDEDACEMIGQDTGKRYRLGEQVTIRVEGVERMDGAIDFSIADGE